MSNMGTTPTMPAGHARFSVVIPLYNKIGQIAMTLASVMGQTLAPREVIVVDNGSTDGSLEAVEALAHPLVRIAHEGQRGPGPARNCGIAEAQGEWIAFLDADDLWSPNHLEVLHALTLRHPGCALVGTGFTRAALPVAASPADREAVRAPSREIDFLEGNNCDLIWTSAVAGRRPLLLAAGGFAVFPAGEDTDLWIRLAMTHRFAVSEAQTAIYVRGNGGIMEAAEAELRRELPPPPSPNLDTIALLLGAPAHRARHAALRAYDDMLRVRFARQMVYHGHGQTARALLDGATARDWRWWMLWGASLLPRAALRLGARAWRLRRRLQGKA
jgi:glycosyltransferase involved in cell wall biosynthesis